MNGTLGVLETSREKTASLWDWETRSRAGSATNQLGDRGRETHPHLGNRDRNCLATSWGYILRTKDSGCVQAVK